MSRKNAQNHDRNPNRDDQPSDELERRRRATLVQSDIGKVTGGRDAFSRFQALVSKVLRGDNQTSS